MEKVKNLENELKLKFQTKSKYYSELQDGLYRVIKEETGFELGKLYDSIFSVHNGFELNWKNDDLICGEINVLRVHHSFSTALQERFIHAFDEFGEEFKKFARQFYPLDIYRESLDAVTLTVVKIIDEEHLELWIWNNAGQKYKLKFQSIEEYLEAGVKCKFIVCWQYFYVDTEALDFNDPFTKEWIASSFGDVVSRMTTALETMKEHFPDEDWGYQENELERMKLI